MAKKALPLKEISIEELFISGEKSVYEVPIYQRNYAWEKEEVSTLIQDVYDAYKKDNKRPYFIGTLVTFHKGDRVFEVIDGQQRLTTIRLILGALGETIENQLTYRARKKSDTTLKSIPNFNVEEKDLGIQNGYRYAEAALGDVVVDGDRSGFTAFFKGNVHIVHYMVPKDIDLNHYFEVMNSRGEQLEKHEIVKAQLMEKIKDDTERKIFNSIWECCSEMSIYVQQNLGDFKTESVFGNTLDVFIPENFNTLLEVYNKTEEDDQAKKPTMSINDILGLKENPYEQLTNEEYKKDSFQPIIDFPNFLLIVLKMLRMEEPGFSPVEFYLDDKELLNEFHKTGFDEDKVRRFAYLLLKVRYLLDNYVVHHSKEDDTIDSNPWKLQVWHKDPDTKKGQLKNLSDVDRIQDKLAHLLSMFEVSFTPRQRKNYLFYCLFYLIKQDSCDLEKYLAFVEGLARRYFVNVYLDGSKLNAINTPLPGSFDEAILSNGTFSTSYMKTGTAEEFTAIYGDGKVESKGVPLFIFNYMDYKLWEVYDKELRGKQLKEENSDRRAFFERLGCADFGLKVFDQFYFSRTRRSLEHYYPQATATGEDGLLNQNQINCFGNFAMIGSEANSSGSNWSPKTKIDHYLDSSGKISQIGVASLKFMVMMQMCKDNQQWTFEEIKNHQAKMVDILLKC